MRTASILFALTVLSLAASARAESAPSSAEKEEYVPPPLPTGAGVPLPRAKLDLPEPGEPPMPPATRLIGNHLLAFRYNPLGLEYQLRAGVQRRLYKDRTPSLRDNFVFAGFAPRINPAFIKFGPSIEIQPLSIFNLRVGAEVIGFFSTFGFLQSFTSPNKDYSDSELNRGRDAKRNYSTAGGHFMIEPSVQFRVGNFVLRDKLAIEHWRMNLNDGDQTFYDVTLDTLISNNGWVVANDADLLYLHDFKDWTGTFRGARLTVGARYSLVKPFYQDKDFAPGESQKMADANAHHRVGPLIAFTFYDHGFESFNRPTALLIANWYTDHRFRTGADVNQAIPYFVLAFAAQTDLLK